MPVLRGAKRRLCKPERMLVVQDGGLGDGAAMHISCIDSALRRAPMQACLHNACTQHGTAVLQHPAGVLSAAVPPTAVAGWPVNPVQ
jgi:hypothetical protein